MKPFRREKRSPGASVVAALTFALAAGCGAAGGGSAEMAIIQARTAAGDAGPGPGTAWVIFGADTVRVEVARTSEERSRGLMYREELPAGTGMLFVFPDEAPRSFWMQNTYVSLDIAFLDRSLRIVDIQQMEARSEDLHDSAGPAMFALEVPLGWFAEHGVEVGETPEVVFGG